MNKPKPEEVGGILQEMLVKSELVRQLFYNDEITAEETRHQNQHILDEAKSDVFKLFNQKQLDG